MLLIRTLLPLTFLFLVFFPRKQERGTESGAESEAQFGDSLGETLGEVLGEAIAGAVGEMDWEEGDVTSEGEM